MLFPVTLVPNQTEHYGIGFLGAALFGLTFDALPARTVKTVAQQNTLIS